MAVKKVTAFVGSGRKRHTYNAVREFCDRLEAAGGVETEIVRLSEFHLETCRGCYTCFAKGEEFCPFKDDRDVLLEKLESSDGVVFASPNFAFQVSGLMKVFLDRISFLFHRPRLHGKTCTSIVVQGIGGGGKIRKYLDFVGYGLGFKVVKGSVFNTREPVPAKALVKRSRILARQAGRFHRQLSKPLHAVPGLLDLLVFRFARTSLNIELDESDRDYRYYRDKGWFSSDYWYPTRLGVLKSSVGRAVDAVVTLTSHARAA